jgi:hypothetical protein
LGAVFWFTHPQKPLGFGESTLKPSGFFSFQKVGNATPKLADRFGGLNPIIWGIWWKIWCLGGLGVDSPTFGSQLAKPLYYLASS